MASQLEEGWGVVTGRKAYYYRGTFSLCGRRGFYQGPLEAENGPSPDDCARCRRRLEAEMKRARRKLDSRLIDGP